MFFNEWKASFCININNLKQYNIQKKNDEKDGNSLRYKIINKNDRNIILNKKIYIRLFFIQII